MKKKVVLTPFQIAKQERDEKIINLYKSMVGAKTAIYAEIAAAVGVSASTIQAVCETFEDKKKGVTA